MISNPPSDATDPEEWRQYFKDSFDAHVTTCTVAVDNDLLVRTLVERREKLKLLRSKLKPGTPLDTLSLSRIAAEYERRRGSWKRFLGQIIPDVPELYGRLAALNIKAQG